MDIEYVFSANKFHPISTGVYAFKFIAPEDQSNFYLIDEFADLLAVFNKNVHKNPNLEFYRTDNKLTIFDNKKHTVTFVQSDNYIIFSNNEIVVRPTKSFEILYE